MRGELQSKFDIVLVRLAQRSKLKLRNPKIQIRNKHLRSNIGTWRLRDGLLVEVNQKNQLTRTREKCVTNYFR
jgi:hypothetical protein